jgi:Flp pilus assembly protein TadG
MGHRKLGQSMVELALLLPVFVALTMGIIDFGWYIYNYSALENAARRGSEQATREAPTRLNASRATDPCVMEIVRQAQLSVVGLTLPASSVTVQYPNTGEDRAVGSIIEVRVQYTGNFLTPLTTLFGARTFTIDFRSRRSVTDTNSFEPSARCQ